MKELTRHQRALVESAYFAIYKLLDYFKLSENDIEDWHGLLSVELCLLAQEYSGDNKDFKIFAVPRLRDKLCSALENTDTYSEIPCGLIRKGF